VVKLAADAHCRDRQSRRTGSHFNALPVLVYRIHALVIRPNECPFTAPRVAAQDARLENLSSVFQV
jgi:hypothetical protein